MVHGQPLPLARLLAGRIGGEPLAVTRLVVRLFVHFQGKADIAADPRRRPLMTRSGLSQSQVPITIGVPPTGALFADSRSLVMRLKGFNETATGAGWR